MSIVVIAALAMAAVYLWAPRGEVTGRTSLAPGLTFTLTKTSMLPLLLLVPRTSVTVGGMTWVFALVQLPDQVCRAYIIESPAYGRRSDTLHATHRLRDQFDRKFVCWDPEPTNPNVLAGVLALWVTSTTHYLATGTFPTATAAFDKLNAPGATHMSSTRRRGA